MWRYKLNIVRIGCISQKTGLVWTDQLGSDRLKKPRAGSDGDRSARPDRCESRRSLERYSVKEYISELVYELIYEH